MTFQRIKYSDLNSRQQENYNFQKVAGELADYGYTCLKLSDDWQGADFLAVHINGSDFLKVQLKGRCSIFEKYYDKNIYIAFLLNERCFVYPHDLIMDMVLESRPHMKTTKAWQQGKGWSWSSHPKWLIEILTPYEI